MSIEAPYWVRYAGYTLAKAQAARKAEQVQQAGDAEPPRPLFNSGSPEPPSFRIQHSNDDHQNGTIPLRLGEIWHETLQNPRLTRSVERYDSRETEVLVGWALAGAVTLEYGIDNQDNSDWNSFFNVIFERQIDLANEFIIESLKLPLTANDRATWSSSAEVTHVKWYPPNRRYAPSIFTVKQPRCIQIPYTENKQFFQELHQTIPGLNVTRTLVLPCSYILFLTGLERIKQLIELKRSEVSIFKVLIPMLIYWFVLSKGVDHDGMSLRYRYLHSSAGWEQVVRMNTSDPVLGTESFISILRWWWKTGHKGLEGRARRVAEWWISQSECKTERTVVSAYLISMFYDLDEVFSGVSGDFGLRAPHPAPQPSRYPHGTSHALSHPEYHSVLPSTSEFVPVAR
ncbi:hypothetical protein JCM3765_004184 [Sporobolomyces pararoseus]